MVYDFNSKIKELEEQFFKEYGKPDEIRAMKNESSYKKDIMRQLYSIAKGYSVKEDELISEEVFICIDPNTSPYMNELLIEYKIKEHYLRILEQKDFINKFRLFPKDLSENKTHDDAYVAEVRFNPKRFLQKYTLLKEKTAKGNYPKFKLIDKNYYWIPADGIPRKINGQNTVKILEKVKSQSGSIILETLFNQMNVNKRKFMSESLQPIQQSQVMMRPIINAKKEIQRVINSKWTFTMWLNDKPPYRLVHFNFAKKTKMPV